MKHKLTAGVVISGLLAVSLSAGEAVQKVYTLRDCITTGLERAVPLANARRDQAVSDALVMQARSEAMPQLTLGAQYIRLDELQDISFGDTSFEFGVLDSYSGTVELNQLLYAGGRVGAALRAAETTKNLSVHALNSVKQKLVKDISVLFYDLLLAREAVAVREDSIAYLESFRKDVEGKFKNGAVSEFDLLSAKVRLSNEKPLLIDAENNLAVLKEQFRVLVNMEDDRFEITGGLEHKPLELDLEDACRHAMLRSPRIARMENEVELLAENVNSAKSKYRPELRAVGQYNAANAYSFVEYEDPPEMHWNASLVLKWTLADGGMRRGEVAQRELEHENAVENNAELKRLIKLEIRQAYLKMKHASEAVEATAGNIELADRARKIALSRNDAGLGTSLEVSDANLSWNVAKLAHLEALCSHMKAVANLKYAAGIDDYNEMRLGNE